MRVLEKSLRVLEGFFEGFYKTRASEGRVFGKGWSVAVFISCYQGFQ